MRAWVVAIALCGCGSHAEQAGVIDAPVPHHPDGPTEMIDADLLAPTDVPFVPCTDSMAQVYAAIPLANAPLGTILACAVDPKLDSGSLAGLVGSGVSVTSGVAQYRIAYQTRDGGGNPAASTARVYLPTTPITRPVPRVLAGHGSVGLADSCVPSVASDNSLPLPYAAGGFATIAPDLSGLGNAGTQDYLDNRAQGWQMIDGGRALTKLLAPGLTSPDVILTGYSQGGGAALSARALINADGADAGHVVATVTYAPEWPIRLNSFGYLDMLDNPTELTVETGISNSSVAVMRQYAFLEDHVAIGDGQNAVPTQFRTALQSAIQGDCLVELGAYIQFSMLHTSDLIDPTLRTGLLACIDSQGTQAGCTGDAESYYNFMIANQLDADATAGPVMMMQGGLDLIMPAASEGACIHDKLASSGVDVSTCVYGTADHTNIMDHHAMGVTWAESVYAGGPRAVCDSSDAMPACGLDRHRPWRCRDRGERRPGDEALVTMIAQSTERAITRRGEMVNWDGDPSGADIPPNPT